MNLREYIDSLKVEGYTVRDDHGDDPVLVSPDGRAVETWKQDCPYPSLMSRNDYEVEKYLLQIELLKFQYWTTDTGAKHVILFEGRDAAGKGGTTKRFVEHLNPRAARVVALTKPTSTEDGQWFFQRYVSHLPISGEIVLFDRSWYNRGGRAGDGVLHRRRVCRLHPARTGSRRCWSIRHDGDQALVLGHPGGAAHPIRGAPDRPRAPVEALADGPGEPGQVGGVHPGQGGDVRAHRLRPRAVDHDQEQRQEARPDRGDARRLHRFAYEGKDPEVVFAPDHKLVGWARDALTD